MNIDAPARRLFRLLCLAGTVLALGVPGLVAASETIVCDASVLLASSPHGGAQLGWSLSANGEWLAAGANQDNGNAGSVALYRNPHPGVRPDQEIRPSDLQTGDQFGSSVSLSGDWLAVGAPGKTRGSGVVYLFQLVGSSWVQKEPRLSATDAAGGAHFGASVSLSGKTLVVGASGDSGSGSSSGAAYVFELQEGGWQQTKKLLANDGRPFDEFGSSVAIDGNEIVVGAPFADELHVFKNFGAAYVFKRDSTAGGWAPDDKDKNKGKLTAADTFRGDNIQFGSSVAIRGNRIVVGAPGDDLQGTDSGSAYVFERTDAGWSGKQTVQDLKPHDQFGTSVAIDGDRVVVGARSDGGGAGAAYLFERQSDASWKPKFKFQHTPGGAFGQSVVSLGDQVFMGGFQYTVDTATHAGAVATCPLSPSTVKPALTCTKTGPASVETGGSVTYSILVTNTGGAAATGVTLKDPTPTGLTFIGADKPCDGGFPCSLGTIGAGMSLPPVKVTFQVAEDCLVPSSITNSATVTGDGLNPPPCSAPTTTVIRPPRKPVLECVKQERPGSVRAGGVVTYDITVSNNGECTAANNVSLSDPTPAGLIYMSGPCVQSPCNLGTIGPGQSQTVTVSFKIPTNPVPPVCAAPTSATNIAKVVGSNAPEKSCSITTAVLPEADLGVNVSAPQDVPGGNSFPVAVVVTNGGPQTAQSVTVDVSITAAGVIESFPAQCTQVGSQPDRFTCLLGDMNCGASNPLNFSVRAPACVNCAAGVPIGVTAEAKSQTFDPTLPDLAKATIQVICPPTAAVTITKVDNPDPVVPGQGLVYDITVKNNGATSVPGNVVLDDFPPELRSVRWCRGAGCTPILPPPLEDTVDLAAGEAKFYRLSGIVQPMCSGVLHNKATITPPAGFCDDPSDNQHIEDTQVVANGVLAFCEGISGPLLQFTAITKTFLLLNCGPANQADNPGDELTDTLPPSLTLTGASATSGVASTSGNTATWNGAIPVGGTVTINITATIVAPAGTKICNQATIAFDADGDGINESTRFSDDPDEPGPADPCCFTVIPPNIPAISPIGLAALALLLASLALLRLRRRSS